MLLVLDEGDDAVLDAVMRVVDEECEAAARLVRAAAHQVAVARIRAERLQSRLDLQVPHRARALLAGLLQPREGLVLVAQAGRDLAHGPPAPACVVSSLTAAFRVKR